MNFAIAYSPSCHFKPPKFDVFQAIATIGTTFSQDAKALQKMIYVNVSFFLLGEPTSWTFLIPAAYLQCLK